MIGRKCPDDWFAYLQGDCDAREKAELREHLAACSRCRDALERDRELLEQVARPEETLAATDLTGKLRERIAAAAPRAGSRLRMLTAAAAVACLVLVVLGLSLLTSKEEKTPGESIRRKGGAAAADRWSGIEAWVIDKGGRARRVEDGARLPIPASLAFSYTNLGDRPFSHLAIFAVDSTGRCWWLHPGWQEGTPEPRSIAITGGVAGRELPEKITIQPAPGRARIYAVFSRKPLAAGALEKLLGRLHARGRLWSRKRLPLPDTGQQALDIDFEP